MLAHEPSSDSHAFPGYQPEAETVIRLPRVNGVPTTQDREWCEVLQGGICRRLRFHDYHEIYRVPGLYELLFYDCLKCCSPSRVIGLLAEVLAEEEVPPAGLRALDVGAGNGMVGEELRRLGLAELVGLDIIPEARQAAERDRPGIYDEYVVADLTNLTSVQRQSLRRRRFDLMTTVAALGFGDIPPAAFLEALAMVETGGWLAFNIKENFLFERDVTGFCRAVRNLQQRESIRVHAYRRYRHRFSTSGEGLYYVAVVARKTGEAE